MPRIFKKTIKIINQEQLKQKADEKDKTIIQELFESQIVKIQYCKNGHQNYQSHESITVIECKQDSFFESLSSIFNRKLESFNCPTCGLKTSKKHEIKLINLPGFILATIPDKST